MGTHRARIFSISAAIPASASKRREGLATAPPGVDVSAEAIEIARGLYPENRFFSGTRRLCGARRNNSTPYLCREVIEHMPEVHSFMASLKSPMRVGGVLWLTTPDAGHFRVPKDFPTWKEVIPPEHISFFNLASLQRLFQANTISRSCKAMQWKPSLRVLARRVITLTPQLKRALWPFP